MAYSRPEAPDDVRPLETFGNSARFLYEEEHLAEPAEAARWLHEHEVTPRPLMLDEAGLDRLVRFRETLRDHLDDRPVAAALNEFAAATVSGPRWTPDGPPALAPSAADGPEELIGRLLGVLFRAEVTGQARRLKPCRAPECRWLFYDRSPAGNSVWCAMDICGARHKMRSYRARR